MTLIKKTGININQVHALNSLLSQLNKSQSTVNRSELVKMASELKQKSNKAFLTQGEFHAYVETQCSRLFSRLS